MALSLSNMLGQRVGDLTSTLPDKSVRSLALLSSGGGGNHIGRAEGGGDRRGGAQGQNKCGSDRLAQTLMNANGRQLLLSDDSVVWLSVLVVIMKYLHVN
ncbi:hypothetical protein GUJ93_ZPchr0007g5501 [Zizania palustris]|uniref:Uncharacterized protein n=1 Tax=Zizania palustris TaxID=103762 RepID=A0A8J5SVS2_ZIZPA|nr:hypothetical protein GUJ93_ZPchr0007g5501 [Zizania palustris]